MADQDWSLDRANAAMSDKASPDYAKFWANDKATSDAVNKTLLAAHPGERDLGADPVLEQRWRSSGMPPQEEQAAQARAPQQVAEMTADELAAVNSAVDQGIRQDFPGSQWDEANETVGEILRSAFSSEEEMIEMGKRLGINQNAEAQRKLYKALYEIGKSRR